MTNFGSSIVGLYNHLRFIGVSNEQTSKWVNTDLELVAKPGLIQRLLYANTDTKVTSILETLSAEIAKIKNKSIKDYADFVLSVLTIRSKNKDHNFGVLSRINVARYLLSRADQDDSNFASLHARYEGFERRYMLGDTVKSSDVQTLIAAIKNLPLHCWSNFVPDVLVKVFEYLSVIDLACAAKVNRHWEAYAQAAWQKAKRAPTAHLLSLARNLQVLPLQYVAENQRAIRVFKEKKLSSRKICDLSISGTLGQDAPYKFVSDNNICVVTNNNTLIVLKSDLISKVTTKTLLRNYTARPLVHRGEVYLSRHSPDATESLYLARVDMEGVREILCQKLTLRPQCVSIYKTKAYFALSNNHLATVDLETKEFSQTPAPFQGHIYKHLAYDRYIYSDQQTDLKVKNLSNPQAVDITLSETVGATVLSSTPSLVVVIIPNALKIAVFSLDTGEKVFSCDSDLLGSMRARIHRGMLFLEKGDFNLKVIDLATKEVIRNEDFNEPTLCHPYLDKILFATYPDFGWGPYALQEMG